MSETIVHWTHPEWDKPDATEDVCDADDTEHTKITLCGLSALEYFSGHYHSSITRHPESDIRPAQPGDPDATCEACILLDFSGEYDAAKKRLDATGTR